VDVGALLSLAASGLLIGFVSGLVGIGGGVLIVPLLYFFYAEPGWSGVLLDDELHAVVAHATSLFVIVPTAVLGTWTYHRAGAVAWRAALPMAVFSMVAAVVATRITPMVPAAGLKLGFGMLLTVSGLQLLFSRRAPPDPAAATHIWLGATAGLAVGVLSALLGVGGGLIAIPILVHVMGVGLEKVAATSLAIVVFTAAAAVVGYASSGPGPGLMPPGSIGYIHYVAGIPILATTVISVRLGARVNQRLSVGTLRLMFGIFFILLGLRLVIQNFGALPGLG
jgi:uncharacterized protein